MPEACADARRVSNQMPIYIRQIISTTMENRPKITAIPPTFQIEDVHAATLATQVLSWREREDEEWEKQQSELMWLLICGEVLRMTWWDPGKITLTGERGDVRTETIDFFRYVKDPYSIGRWPPRWLTLIEAREVDWVKETFGVSVEPESVSRVSEIHNEMATGTAWARNFREDMKDAVLLRQHYIPPTNRYPDGHCWVWANDKVLRDFDLQLGIWPFAKAPWFPLPGRLYPMGLVELLMTDQRELNILLSQMQEQINQMVRGDFVVSGVGTDDISEDTVNEVTGRKRIHLGYGVDRYEPVQSNINWAEAEHAYNRIKDELRQKAGASQPFLGQMSQRPERVGTLQLAREQNLENLAWHMTQLSDGFLCPIARQKLQLIREFLQDWRLMSAIGEPETAGYFRGAELGDTRDVVTVSRPHLTPALKQQAKLQAYEMQLMGPYETPMHELAARIALEAMGLDELVQKLTVAYGSFEQVQAKAQAYSGRMEELTTLSMVMQAAMLTGGMQGGGQGQPGGPPQLPMGQGG